MTTSLVGPGVAGEDLGVANPDSSWTGVQVQSTGSQSSVAKTHTTIKPFIVDSNNIKYVGITITKQVKYLCDKNY